jgi:hypothetical protein
MGDAGVIRLELVKTAFEPHCRSPSHGCGEDLVSEVNLLYFFRFLN